MIALLAVLRDRTPCLVRVSSELREILWRHSPAAVLQHCDIFFILINEALVLLRFHRFS